MERTGDIRNHRLSKGAIVVHCGRGPPPPDELKRKNRGNATREGAEVPQGRARQGELVRTDAQGSTKVMKLRQKTARQVVSRDICQPIQVANRD